MKSYRDFVEAYSHLMREANRIPFGAYSSAYKPDVNSTSPKVILFSPHPDDESITGALPLRLLRDMKMAVANVPITYGSNIKRRRERHEELARACDFLGFAILEIQEDGIIDVKTKTRVEQPAYWNSIVDAVAKIMSKHRPHVIFTPHVGEFNTTHAGTHELVFDALSRQNLDYACYVVEWEYWTPMEKPNLLIEVSREYLVDLVTAVSFHSGEVQRNPQHVNLPAWMQDNVRRGAELISGEGATAPNFEFATIYWLRKWEKGEISDPLEKGQFISSKSKISDLFSL